MKFVRVLSIIGIVISGGAALASAILADVVQLDAILSLILFALIATSAEAND